MTVQRGNWGKGGSRPRVSGTLVCDGVKVARRGRCV